VGIKKAEPEELFGGSPLANAKITYEVLDGETGPRSDIILLNAAAGLVVAGVAENLVDGVERSRASIASGAAKKCLTELVAFTRSLGEK
jgi:anthranilate phosphoribosyltransferase